MMHIIQNAAGLAAACAITGIVFLRLFRVRHWKHGDSRESYSPVLAVFTTLLFTAMPMVLWVGTTESARLWSLEESVAASVATWVVLRLYTASAKRDMQARLARRHRRLRW